MFMSNGSDKIQLGVLGSGSGSNMQAILDAIANESLNAEIVIVLSDNPNAYILERAKDAGIQTEVIDCGGYQTRFPDESQRYFPNRILNIHPSLLPAYPGLMAWKQAVEDGAKESGCTVHYVDAGMDTGPIILQAKVSVLPEDTAETLHARIQEQEHQLYPAAIKAAWQKIQSVLKPLCPMEFLNLTLRNSCPNRGLFISSREMLESY